MIALFLRIAVASAVVTAFYGYAMRRIGTRLLPMVTPRRLGTAYAVGEVEDVVRLALSGISQGAACLAAVPLLGASAANLGLTRPSASRLLLGVLLGVGELGLGSLLSYAAVMAAIGLVPRRVPNDPSDWLAIARGGWMRRYLTTFEIMPIPAALALVLLYVTGEELVFRALLLHWLAPAGAVTAVGVSTLLFAGVQAFATPSWHAAMFPMIGGLMLGVIHGTLFWIVPDITPLIAAHVTFFLFALV
jgi:hypothetical protein